MHKVIIACGVQVVAGHRLMAESIRPQRDGDASESGVPDDLPFELDVLEAALHVSVSKLDSELLHTQDLVQTCLHRLPRDITPGNLDELRKAKSALVELESKSDAFRCVPAGRFVPYPGLAGSLVPVSLPAPQSCT